MKRTAMFAGQTSLIFTVPVTEEKKESVTDIPKETKKVTRKAAAAKKSPKKSCKEKASPLKKFYDEYNGKVIEDDITVASEDFKSYCRKLKNALKKEAKLKGFDDVTLRPNHYDMSGFFKKGDRYVYYSFSVARYGYPTSLDGTDPMTGFLYRTAKSEKDYTGGNNHFTNLLGLVDNALVLVDGQQEREGLRAA